ncbi:MAG: hypothetical protein ABIH46_14170 [Chloroflexota bacterium]
MSYNNGALVAAAVAVLGGLWWMKRRGGYSKETAGSLEGEFTLQPASIVAGGTAYASALAEFSGVLHNNGNAPFNGTARLEVFSGGPQPIASKTISLSVVPGGQVPVIIGATINEQQAPGDVVAAVTILDSAGTGLITKTSPVLGTIESAFSLDLTGGFGVR